MRLGKSRWKGHEEKNWKSGNKIVPNVIFKLSWLIWFSFDSIILTVGMTNGVEGALLYYDHCCSYFGINHDAVCCTCWISSTNILLFKFWVYLLILIGMMLLTESAHLSNALIFGSHVTPPKVICILLLTSPY
jgi:predicted tellurium resistance membrane protein TerC